MTHLSDLLDYLCSFMHEITTFILASSCIIHQELWQNISTPPVYKPCESFTSLEYVSNDDRTSRLCEQQPFAKEGQMSSVHLTISHPSKLGPDWGGTDGNFGRMVHLPKSQKVKVVLRRFERSRNSCARSHCLSITMSRRYG